MSPLPCILSCYAAATNQLDQIQVQVYQKTITCNSEQCRLNAYTVYDKVFLQYFDAYISNVHAIICIIVIIYVWKSVSSQICNTLYITQSSHGGKLSDKV